MATGWRLRATDRDEDEKAGEEGWPPLVLCIFRRKSSHMPIGVSSSSMKKVNRHK